MNEEKLRLAKRLCKVKKTDHSFLKKNLLGQSRRVGYIYTNSRDSRRLFFPNFLFNNFFTVF